MDLLPLFARLFLAAVFALAGFAKLADRAGSRKSMSDFGLPPGLAPVFAVLLPLAELACAAALIPVSLAWWGAAGVLILLVLFIAAIAFNMAQGRRPDCHCFGQLHSTPIGWATLFRNTVFCAFAGLILWQGPGLPLARIPDWLAGLSWIETAVLGLAVVCAALVLFTLWSLSHLLRQNGRLLLRMEAIEAKIGINANVPPPPTGLPLDNPAPDFALPALSGEIVTLEALKKRALPVLLIFTEPACGACESLLPDVAEWQREYAVRLTIVLVSRDTADANHAKSQKYGVGNTILQNDREVAKSYMVEATPSAVLIVGGRIANQLAVGPDAIRGLVARTVLSPITQGEAVPALRLPDLNGNTVDLATLRDRRSLLLFWNPSCGFCQNMLPDLRKWEQTSPDIRPRLIVVSSGSMEDNGRQDFHSPVLLDPALSAMYIFGASGTPSAVMLDEDGRLASGVEVGADAVLALAGAMGLSAKD